MSTVIVPHRNGTGPHAGNGTRRTAPAPASVVALLGLGEEVDRLLELRALLKQATEAEKTETRAIVQALQAAGCDRAHGRLADV